ncbi:hypothetical protein KIH27_11735 [Mycobacterium sp. M1]|uniref:CDGP domain-containing protein n=1 Tax=Mycolicibacter acidiphilus TaxID=2835306 RepID=A0ABS5RIY1_9MYCO|nr:hypothetical protein [Mycolicibacter acidiphilus]MBS9534258.1 hypothetical protein [Mycolicibacter acidiphilus]
MATNSALRGIVIGAVVTATALTPTAPAGADPGIPGDPDTRCESDAFGTTQWCDEPIRPDGTWRRCWHTSSVPFFNGSGGIGGYIPETGRCVTLDAGNIPFGQPGHIDG